MTTSPRLGVVTIGQSPRDDLVPELVEWLPPVRITERGALDGLSAAEIRGLAPSGEASHHVLTTRLADGSSVVLDHDAVIGRVQGAIDQLEQDGVDATLVVCTGEFPALVRRQPLLLAERLFVGGVAGICGAGDDAVLGVVCPLAGQVAMSRHKWARVAGRVEVAVASPYDEDAPDAVGAAAADLVARGASWLVLDCMGYTKAMRLAALAAGVPVLLARSVVGRLAGEVVA